MMGVVGGKMWVTCMCEHAITINLVGGLLFIYFIYSLIYLLYSFRIVLDFFLVGRSIAK